jgi:hypothetical protein
MHEIVKKLPPWPKKPELGPTFYKFFRPPETNVRMKPKYELACCKTCGRYDSYKVFDLGFEDPVSIRMRPDFGHTNDRIFIISDKFLKVLRDSKVRGYETKPVSTSGWHALRVTLLVQSVEGVVQPEGSNCPECGRPEGAHGLFEELRQLALPSQNNTFFTTKSSWPAPFSDRDIFITEDALMSLKSAGIKGGYCNRLWNEKEAATVRQKGPAFKPPKTTVYLSGK